MLIIPSPLVSSLGEKNPRRRPNTPKRRRDPNMKGAAHSLTDLSHRIYGGRTVKPPSAYPTKAAYINRRCFQYCDALYKTLLPEQKAEWRAAITKASMSPYDLWMKENLALTYAGLCPADHPSISGGWSGTKAIEGTTHDPCPCWPPPTVNAILIEPSTELPAPPPLFLKWRIRILADPSTLPLPLEGYVHLHFGWNLDVRSWSFKEHITGFRYDYHVTIGHDALPYAILTFFLFNFGVDKK